MLPRFQDQFKTLKTPYHMSELVGQTNPVLRTIQLLIRTIQSYQFIPKMVCTANMGFSKNFLKRLIFHFSNDRSGLHILAFGNHL